MDSDVCASTTGEVRFLKMLRLTKQGQLIPPNGKCTCRQRLCLSARASMCPPRKLGEKKPTTKKRPAVINFQTLSSGVEQLGEFFNGVGLRS